jgi:LDH2 family malate/lactate/ureidoglycolate dehydrogenase
VTSLEEARTAVAHILAAGGYPRGRADLVADSLVDAEGRGIASHGITRTRVYVDRVRAGLVDASAEPSVDNRSRACRTVDAHNSPGQIAAQAAVAQVVEAAARWGIGMVGVVNSNHCGALGYFLRRIAAAGHVGLAASNGPAAMTYYGARVKAVGTNPLGYAVPRRTAPPIVLDMATSVVAKGRIIHAAKVGQTEIPPDWAVDPQGRPATTPAAALAGAVVPFGGPKGSGLAMGIDLLCGALLSGVTGSGIGDMYDDWARTQRVGHIFIAVDPEAWTGREKFAASVEAFVAEVKALPVAPGHERVLLPGEPEDQRLAVAARDGLNLSPLSVADLNSLAAEVGLGSNVL